MPDQPTLCAKAYFLPVRGEAGEVHRFPLDEETKTDFNKFQQKLVLMYPDLKDKELIVTYRGKRNIVVKNQF